MATLSRKESVDVRLTITIQNGTRAGQRILLAPEESLRVGRTSKADIAITDDPTMSGTHFSIEYSGESAKVHDLGSRNGLFVNGQQVVEMSVQTGDQIRAGRTLFSVSLEGAEPAGQEPGGLPGDETRRHQPTDPTRADLPPPARRAGRLPAEAGTVFVDLAAFQGIAPEVLADPPASPGVRDSFSQSGGAPAELASMPEDDPTLDSSAYRRLIEQRAGLAGRLYAVVDGSIAHVLVQEAKQGNLRTETLLTSASSPYLAAVAPYLIEVRSDSGFLLSWRAMSNKNPGILIESQAEFDVVLSHVRGIFSRRDERGKQSFFRFYDPRLLYGWLSSCTPAQLASFFGCLSAVVVGLESGDRILRLTCVSDALHAEEVFSP
ncbi:MAG TPA: DUF4123 domain-containing protein [Pirellulales bacterium]|jgi:hypothetical protein|nr:DUF4123 domain-containing protein [Pirellulales bacterium]